MPLFVYLRRKGISPDDSADYVQGFLAELVEKDFVKAVDRKQGRFRWFLMAAINRFISKQIEKNQAIKRGGAVKTFSIDLSIDVTSAEKNYQNEPTDGWTPEKIFDRRWALTVLKQTLGQLQSDYQCLDQSALFQSLQPMLMADSSKAKYKDIAQELGMSEAYMRPKKCPECSTPVVDELPGGLCPACLMAAARRSNPTYGETEGMSQRIDPPRPEKLDAFFPELEIIELIGTGGMGAVYKAKQKNLDRLVALKIFLFRDLESQITDRFKREAKALAKLAHQNIVTIHDFGKRDQYHYLLMEYVDGPNLRQVVSTSKLSPSESIGLVPQLCDALQYAHDNGVVHRDIKPENVLLDREGKIKIADFGLAKLTDQSTELGLTNTRQVMGTFNYMAPEQRETPTLVDHRADIYSLGVVIYELLTGELPLGRFQPPSKRVKVDARMDEVVMRALEREPSRRYQQINDFKTGIQSVAHLAPDKFTPMPPVKTKQPARAQSDIIDDGDNKIRTIPNLIYYILCMFVICVGVITLVLSTEEFFPEFFEQSSFGQLPGILILMFGGYMFACTSHFQTMINRGSRTTERMLAAFGCLAIFCGIAGGACFVIGNHAPNVISIPKNAMTKAEKAADKTQRSAASSIANENAVQASANTFASYPTVEDYRRQRHEFERMMRAVGIGLCVLCGFLFAVYGVMLKMIEEESNKLTPNV